MKKLLVVLLIVSVAGFAFAQAKTIKNPDTFIYVSYGTIDTLDPSKAYDNATGGLLQNLYEPLIDYKGASTSEFVAGARHRGAHRQERPDHQRREDLPVPDPQGREVPQRQRPDPRGRGVLVQAEPRGGLRAAAPSR